MSTGTFRALREAKGYSVEDVATRLKFTARQIQWLEAEDFDKLPRGIALKGMVKNYAKLLDVSVSTLKELGELCDPCDLEKETLKIPAEELELLKKGT